jgi:alkaline phosphatase D
MRNLFAAISLAALAACSTKGASGPYAGAPESPDGIIQAVPMPSAPLDPSKTLTRIVFASCAQQNEDQRVWDRIAAENAGLILYMGDNVYGDVRSNDPALPELKAAYMRLAMSAPFARVRAAAPLLTVWDDHDMGLNDGGGDYQYKDNAEKLFEYVWDIHDDRAGRPGVYGSWIIGEEGKRVQIIMLDTRYFRSPLTPTDEPDARGKERWIPDADPSKTMLGDAQWAWLENELKRPADLRLLVSSIQVLSEGHGWEAWRELPLERQKLYDVVKRAGAERLIILSGDRHSAALYQRNDVIDYPLFEATSSSLNLPASKWRAQTGDNWVEIDPNRHGDMFYDANYGRIDIDWADESIFVRVIGADGDTALGAAMPFASFEIEEH